MDWWKAFWSCLLDIFSNIKVINPYLIGNARNEFSLQCMAFMSQHRKSGQTNAVLNLVFFSKYFLRCKDHCLCMKWFQESSLRKELGHLEMLANHCPNEGLLKAALVRVNMKIFSLSRVCSQVTEISAEVPLLQHNASPEIQQQTGYSLSPTFVWMPNKTKDLKICAATLQMFSLNL